MKGWRRLAVTAVTVLATLGTALSARADEPPTPPVLDALKEMPVTGIPEPCAADQAYPEGLTLAQVKAVMEKRWGLRLIGPDWTDSAHGPVVRLVWETLDAIDCTPFLKDTAGKLPGRITINAQRISGYAWGDWSLTKPGAMSVDFSKMMEGYDKGEYERIVRVLVHEMAHVQSVDRGPGAPYWREFLTVNDRYGPITDYAARDTSENYAEVVAHYVARCSEDNPYDKASNKAYYAYVRDNVFDGKEFGPPAGEHPAAC